MFPQTPETSRSELWYIAAAWIFAAFALLVLFGCGGKSQSEFKGGSKLTTAVDGTVTVERWGQSDQRVENPADAQQPATSSANVNGAEGNISAVWFQKAETSFAKSQGWLPLAFVGFLAGAAFALWRREWMLAGALAVGAGIVMAGPAIVQVSPFVAVAVAALVVGAGVLWVGGKWFTNLGISDRDIPSIVKLTKENKIDELGAFLRGTSAKIDDEFKKAVSSNPPREASK